VDKQFIFERNILSLSKNDAALCSRLGTAETTRGRYLFIEARTGEVVPALKSASGQAHPLHSTIDPVREGEKLVATAGQEGCLVFLGLGGGFAVEAALRRSETKKTIVVEFDLDGLAELLCNRDYITLLQDSRFSLLADPRPGEIEAYLTNCYNPALDGGIRVFPLRTRTEAEKRFTGAGEEIKQAIENVSRDYSVQAYFGKRWFSNILRNLRAAEKPAAVIPPVPRAAICAAGPSLDGQLALLGENRLSRYIIATDTSLPALLSQGIEADAVISIDCQQISYRHFLRGLPAKTRLFLDLASPPTVASLSSDPVFFSSGHPLARYIRKTWRPLPYIDTSGANVTYAALSLAEALGAREITVYGADFSYPAGKTYARGAYLYPYFENLQSRFMPVEAQHSAFLYRDRSLVKRETEKSFFYETASLVFYRQKLAEKIQRSGFETESRPEGPVTLRVKNRAPLSIFSAGPAAADFRAFLEKYRDAVKALDSFAALARGGEDAELLTTLLPLAAAVLRSESPLNGERLFDAVQSHALAKLDEIIHAPHS
jgi:hypothetical protein